jgi:hypothetical protein
MDKLQALRKNTLKLICTLHIEETILSNDFSKCKTLTIVITDITATFYGTATPVNFSYTN